MSIFLALTDSSAKRQRQNLRKMETRRLGREKMKMDQAEQQQVAAERRGMSIQEYRGQRAEDKKGKRMSRTQERRARKGRNRLKQKAEEGDKMDVE